MKRRVMRLERDVLTRIQRHLEEHPDEDLVLKVRRGKIGRIYRRSSDEKMRRSPHNHKPWQHRQAPAELPDPLGAVEGTVLGPITRDVIYEE